MKSAGLTEQYLSENWARISFGLLCLIVVDILQLLIPRIIKTAIDQLTALTADSMALLTFGFYIFAIALLIGVFRFFWRICLLGVSRRVEEGLRNRLLEHLQTLSPSYFDRVKTGDLMAHATNDLMHIRMAIGMGLVAITDAAILGTAAIGFMAFISWKLTILVLVPMPLIVFGTRIFSKKMHRRYEKVQASFGDLTEAVRERFAGIRIIKAFTRERESDRHLDEKSRDYIRENIKLVKITGSFFPMMMFFSNISMALVIFWGGRQTILGTITPGDFVAFIAYLGIVTWPMMAMGWVVNMIQRGRASLDRINRILQTRPEIASPENPLRLSDFRGAVEFKNVFFDYGESDGKNEDASGGSSVLSGIDLRVERGKTLGIVGPPGAGKSTLLSLIPRLYDPISGQVLVDGVDIRQLRLEDLRTWISFAPQEPFLFAGTIRENIMFENGKADATSLAEAVEAASLHETIMDFPAGFDTVVGERGVILSGGQKQRVALARSFLKDSPVLLLDDPISQVDMETGAKIVEAIREMARGRTTIIVSHRLSALTFADTIIILEEGRIVASGTHRDLMATNSYYARTFKLQEIEEAFHAA